jgi:hypothetical protein
MTPGKRNSGKTQGSVTEPVEQEPSAMLDRYDLALLRELQADARLSNAALRSTAAR